MAMDRQTSHRLDKPNKAPRPLRPRDRERSTLMRPSLARRPGPAAGL